MAAGGPRYAGRRISRAGVARRARAGGRRARGRARASRPDARCQRQPHGVVERRAPGPTGGSRPRGSSGGACRRLAALGWETWVEASFNSFGERGRIDVLAFEPQARLLVVVEVKTAFGDLQDTLGRLDAKTRLARAVATERGWAAARAVPMLVVADTRTSRRVVAAHASLFGGFDVRGRAAQAWLRHPAGAMPRGLLWFAKRPDSHGVTIGSRERVRVPSQTDADGRSGRVV